jgi:hypothetical protein
VLVFWIRSWWFRQWLIFWGFILSAAGDGPFALLWAAISAIHPHQSLVWSELLLFREGLFWGIPLLFLGIFCPFCCLYRNHRLNKETSRFRPITQFLQFVFPFNQESSV